MNYTQYTVATNFGISGIIEYGPLSQALINSIILPDGTSYTFQYEATTGSCTPLSDTASCVTGRLRQVTLPTGGSITYAYSGGPSSTGIYSDGSTANLGRTLSTGGSWSYTRQLQGTVQPGPGSTWITNIADPQGNQSVLNFAEDLQVSNGTVAATYNMFETQGLVYQGTTNSGNLLNTDVRCYNAIFTSCATGTVYTPIVSIDAYTQPSGGVYRASEIHYNSATGLVTDDSEYDYGATIGAAPSSPLLRETITNYASFGSINKPLSVTVKDGNSNVLSLTSYTYDEGSVQASGASNLTAVSGHRGNPTTVTYSTSSSTAITKHYAYYDTGNLYQVTDLNGAPTTYSYGECGSAYPTQVSLPINNLSNSNVWDCNGGVITSSTGVNGQETGYGYDQFWRLTSTSYPDGGGTGTQYNLSSNPPSVTTTTNIGSNNSESSTVILDGFGRVIETQLTSDPAGTDYFDTTYDQVGRVWKVSNPYRSTSDPTYGLTIYGYDALGRTISTTTPDSKTYSTQYSSNVVITTDPNSSQRQYTYDGIGRLTSVVEPNPNTGQLSGGYTTTYSYNGLKVSVTQNGSGSNQSSRSFIYDWLGRLASASNPETGAVTYTYDSAVGSSSGGDLVQVTSPAPNQTGSAIVNKTYSYDALHRITSVAYSDGITPSACYQYDAVSPNGAGSLASEWTQASQAGPCPSQAPSSPLTERKIVSYDQMSRVTGEQQCTPANCSDGAMYSITHGYDDLGTETLYTDGVDGISLSSFYNSAHQLQAVTSSWSDPTHPGTLFSSPVYSATGLTSATLGTGLAFQQTYDARLRPYSASTQSVIPSASLQISGADQNKGATASSGTIMIAGSEQSMQKQAGSGTGSTGSITISGNEQSKPPSGTPGTGYVSISGTEQTKAVACPGVVSGGTLGSLQPDLGPGNCLISDSGTVSIVVNGATATVSYGSGSTGSSIATALVSEINQNGSYPVTASLSGSQVNLIAKSPGTSTNYSLSSSSTYMSSQFSKPSFTGTPSGSALTGGTGNGSTIYDSGTATAIINGRVATVSWGQSSTWQSISSALASAITSASGGSLQAAFNGTAISINSTGTGSGTNWPISVSTNYDSSDFSSASFSFVPSGMSGGNNAPMTTIYDNGTVTINVNGSPITVSYGQDDTGATIASKLATAIGSCTASYPAGATASGNVVLLTSCQPGTQANYSLSANTSYDSTDFSSASFTPSTSGSTMTGGTGSPGSLIYDSGTVTLTINGVPGSTSYGQGSTAATVAAGLAAAFNTSTDVSVTSSGTTITISALSGFSSDYSYSVSSTYDTTDFSMQSFSASPSSGSLSNGNTIYNYSLGYDPNGNVQSIVDSVMGRWSYSYDALNRLTQGQSTGGNYSGATLNWGYDAFGNRLSQTGSGNLSISLIQTNYSSSKNNQLDGFNYDAAGNLLQDVAGTQYTYDAENRIVQAGNTEYVYDAEGRRVAKLNAADGTLKSSYVRGLRGDQITELDGSETGSIPTCLCKADCWPPTTITDYTFMRPTG